MLVTSQHSSPRVVEGGVGGGFGGIAWFSRGNGREISSRQQIVQHPQPKRKTELKKKGERVKGKKTIISSFKVKVSENSPAPTLDGKDAVTVTYVAEEQN